MYIKSMKLMISKSVGRGGINDPSDVKWVQERLNLCNTHLTVMENGMFDATTAAAIDLFQGRYLGLSPNGLVRPNESTAIKLAQTLQGCWTPQDTLRMPAKGSGNVMQHTDYMRAANILNVDLATVKAVASVESSGRGFNSQGRPVILYEPHLFSRLTNRKYDEAFPALSSKKWNKALYVRGGTSYEKLEVASALDRSAALQACSWGVFQILGMNFRLCNFGDVDSMVSAMFLNEGEHLLAFVRYVQSTRLDSFLRSKNWRGFANAYNGPLYKQNHYDQKLEKAYRRFAEQTELGVQP
jgi:hypothetical protein